MVAFLLVATPSYLLLCQLDKHPYHNSWSPDLAVFELSALTVYGANIRTNSLLTFLRPQKNLIRHKIIGCLLFVVGKGEYPDNNSPDVDMNAPRLKNNQLHSHSHLRSIKRLPIPQVYVFGLRKDVRASRENPCRHRENIQTSLL